MKWLITTIVALSSLLSVYIFFTYDAFAVAIMLNLIFGIVMFIGYLYLSYLMIKEAVRPYDYLTPLRWRIFATLFIAVLTLIPSLTYQFLRLFGIDSPEIRNIVTVTSRVNGVVTLYLLFSIFTYKRKERK